MDKKSEQLLKLYELDQKLRFRIMDTKEPDVADIIEKERLQVLVEIEKAKRDRNESTE